jgi:uncharacterized protein (DUF934 family)
LVPLMARTGFDAAQLRPGQSEEAAQKALGFFAGHYQGDVQQPLPAFARDLSLELKAPAAAPDAESFAGQGI